MAYLYDASKNRYYNDDTEITKNEYEIGVAKTKEAFAYALKKYKGENVIVPSELSELVDVQFAALVANIPEESEEELTAEEALEIIVGGAV
jgi:hypothetical protein